MGYEEGRWVRDKPKGAPRPRMTSKALRWYSVNVGHFKQTAGERWSAECPSCEEQTLTGDGWALSCENGCDVDDFVAEIEPPPDTESAIRKATTRNGSDILDAKRPATVKRRAVERSEPENLNTSTKAAPAGGNKGTFVMLPHYILESPAYAKLKSREVKLLIDLLAQYRGHNNGKFVAAWSLMRQRGWRSSATLNEAIRGLRRSGFIKRVRKGGTGRPSWYSITWLK